MQSPKCKCPVHRQYKAKLRPKVECAYCWRAYLEQANHQVELASTVLMEKKRVARDVFVHWLKLAKRHDND